MSIAGMTGRLRRTASLAALALAAFTLFAACGGGDEGLSRAEVEEIVRAELAAESSASVDGTVNDTPDVAAVPPAMAGLTRAEVEEIARAELAAESSASVEGSVNDTPDEAAVPPAAAGLTRAEVEEIVRAELAAESSASVEGSVNDTPDEAAVPPATAGLTRPEVEEIVRAAIAGIPTKAAPAEYTQHVVDSAIARYESQGLDAALAHYNSAQSIDGQWYVFIIDENDLVIAHPDPERRGLDVKGWVGTDANGYEFGPEMLAATEEGKWVSYVYRNPESGGIGSGFDDVELKNVWVTKRDGLLFASGWYIDADIFTRQLVAAAVDKYRELGLYGTMAYFASPGSVLAGLEAAVAYYNAAETVEGQWFAFIGGPDGKIVGHSDISMIGRDVQDLFGGADFDATHLTADGEWVESEALRVYVAGYDGHVFGSGWSRDE